VKKGLVPVVPLIWSLTVVVSPSEAAGPDEPSQAPARASSVAAAPTVYFQAGLLATTQPAGVPNHRVTPPFSGRTIGLAAAVGFSKHPTLALEGELVVNGAIATQQQFSYNWRENYTAESRDVFIGANARWRPIPRRPFELVGGGGVAISRFANRSIVVTRPFAIPPTPPTAEPDEVATSLGFALNGGVATPLPVTRGIEIVPAFTVRWVGRSDSGIAGYAGVGSYAYQVGATVRWTFD
jgi:hypothetical protein